MGELMKKIFLGLMGAALGLYMIAVVIFASYFNWQYAAENGFVRWLILGQIVPTAKSLIWPYFVFTRISDTPLNDAELQRLNTVVKQLNESGELRAEDISQVRSVLNDYITRTGVKLSKPQYEESFGVLGIMLEYKYEMGESALLSWDNQRVITTPEFDRLSNQVSGLVPETQLREDRAMIEAASHRQPFIDSSNGSRYELSRASIATGHEKKKRQREAFGGLTHSVVDLLR